MEDRVNILPILNQYGDGNSYVCTGNISVDIKVPLNEKCERLVKAFFEAEFNDDLPILYPPEFAVGSKKGMIGWAEQTKKNRLFALSKVSYNQHNFKTFEGMINGVLA